MGLACTRGEMYKVPHVFNQLEVKESKVAMREF